MSVARLVDILPVIIVGVVQVGAAVHEHEVYGVRLVYKVERLTSNVEEYE